MKIGELARRTGLAPSRIRFYEASGLIAAQRQSNGYRDYPAEAEQTLATGHIDIAIIHPPSSGGAEHNPALRKLWSDYDLDGGLGGMAPYSVYGKFSRENPEATRDVVNAIARAANWVNANPDDARKITSERIGMKLELVERFAYIDDLVVTEPPIQYYIDILENEGKIKKGSIAVKDVYTNEFNPFARGQA